MIHHVLTLTSPSFHALTERARPHLSHNCELTVIECDEPADNQFGQAGFNRVCFAKVDAILEKLHAMPELDWLLYTDADVLFFRPACEIIRNARHIAAGQSLPMVAQHDPESGPCAGFVVMQNTEDVRDLWREVASYRNDGYNDQNVLCALAKSRIGLLPSELVSSWGNTVGGVWTPSEPRAVCVPKDCAAWHLNYTVGIANKMAMAERVIATQRPVLTN
jgi:hypothetical protein